MNSHKDSDKKTIRTQLLSNLSLFSKVVEQTLLSDEDGWPLENLDVRLLLAETDDEVLEIAMERRLLLNNRMGRVVENMEFLSNL